MAAWATWSGSRVWSESATAMSALTMPVISVAMLGDSRKSPDGK